MSLKSITNYFQALDISSYSENEFNKNLLEGAKNNLFKHYKHPLGFYYIELANSKQHRTRLHIWPENLDERELIGPNFPIHDHSWSFKSLILAGEITNLTYRLKNDITGDYFIYGTEYTSAGVELKCDIKNRFQLELESSKAYKKNDSYSMKSGRLHETKVEKGLCVTLLKANYDLNREPIVIGRKSSEAMIYVPRNTSVKDDLFLFVKEIIKSMS